MTPPIVPALRPDAPATATRTRVGLVAAGALAWALLGLPAAALPTDAQDDSALQQAVESDEATVEGREVIDDGHVDVGPRFVDGAWTLQARDDREVPPVWRWPDETVFHVVDDSVLPAPDSPDFAFLGVDPGAPLYVVPQVQNPDVVWLGWNTQDPEVTRRIDRGATLRLNGVDGPGDFFLFLQEGVTGPPNLLWDAQEEYPQDLWMDVNTHVHANWVFTEPGIYTLDVAVLADLVDGTQEEAPSILRFAVGTATDPQTAFGTPDWESSDAAPDETDETDETDESDPGESEAAANPEVTADDTANQGTAAAPETDTTSNVALWVGAAALALVGAVALTVLRGRRARALAEAEVAADRDASATGPASDGSSRGTGGGR